jgi:uncharacterized membrane protein
MCYEIVLPLVLLPIIDSVYLYFNQSYLRRQIVDIQRVSSPLRMSGAIVTYLFLFIGLYLFIIRRRRPVYEAVILGLVIYGVYEFTNFSTFKRWHIETVIMDTLWGGALLGIVTWITYILIKRKK